MLRLENIIFLRSWLEKHYKSHETALSTKFTQFKTILFSLANNPSYILLESSSFYFHFLEFRERTWDQGIVHGYGDVTVTCNYWFYKGFHVCLMLENRSIFSIKIEKMQQDTEENWKNLQVAELACGFVVTSCLSSIVSICLPLCALFANLKAWGKGLVQPGDASILISLF